MGDMKLKLIFRKDVNLVRMGHDIVQNNINDFERFISNIARVII